MKIKNKELGSKDPLLQQSEGKPRITPDIPHELDTIKNYFISVDKKLE